MVFLSAHDEFLLVLLVLIRIDLSVELARKLTVCRLNLILLFLLKSIKFLLLLLPNCCLLSIILFLMLLTFFFFLHLLEQKRLEFLLLTLFLIDNGLFALIELSISSVLVAKHLFVESLILFILDFAKNLSVLVWELLQFFLTLSEGSLAFLLLLFDQLTVSLGISDDLKAVNFGLFLLFYLFQFILYENLIPYFLLLLLPCDIKIELFHLFCPDGSHCKLINSPLLSLLIPPVNNNVLQLLISLDFLLGLLPLNCFFLPFYSCIISF